MSRNTNTKDYGTGLEWLPRRMQGERRIPEKIKYRIEKSTRQSCAFPEISMNSLYSCLKLDYT